MKRVLFMLALILAAVVAITITSTPSKNPLAKVRDKAIVTQPGKFPALVRLTIEGGHTVCSGTVITQNLVLTAAHCLGDGSQQIIVESLPNDKTEVALVPVSVAGYNPNADYALLSGDFSGFTMMDVQTDPEKDLVYSEQNDLVSCGFPYGAGPVCYPITEKVKKLYQFFSTKGQMYPAMSGGPVIDTTTGKIVGVNHGIKDDMVAFTTLIGLFESARGR